MSWDRPAFRVIAAMAVIAMVSSSLLAGVFQPPAGVIVDANGVLRTKVFNDPNGVLTRQRREAAIASLNADVVRPSKLRKISLNRLEAALAARMAQGEGISDEMKFMAGLTRLTHVFYYPDSGDIVVAGPAEGFMQDLSGRPVGIQTQRAVLELQDLVVALRAFPPSGKKTPVVGVSIDPTQQGLTRMQQLLAQVGGRATPGMETRLAQSLRNALGMQTVTIEGISDRTHFAQVLVEADYRMKLIGIGLEQPAVKITSYVSRANPRSVSRNALQRWYFTPNYDCVRVSADKLAMRLEGEGVKLIGEHELVGANGQRVDTNQVDAASQQFVESFTRNYKALSEVAPVYAQMRNLIDMVIAAAYIQQQDFYAQSNWDLGVLGSEDSYPVEIYQAPKQVETAVNAIWKGRTLMTPIGGGVSIHPLEALDSQNRQSDDKGEVAAAHQELQLPADASRWWWD